MDINSLTDGLLSGSDILSLPGSLRINSSYLLDDIVGARHQLDPRVAQLLASISVISVAELFKKAPAFNLSNSDIAEILIFLNSISGLDVRRRWLLKLKMAASYYWSWVVGVKIVQLASRYPATYGRLAKTAVWSVVPVAMASVTSSALLFAAGFISLPGAVNIAGIFIVILVLSLFFHEAAHLFMARRAGVPSVITRRGLRIGILHCRLNWRSETASALAGSLAGLAVSVLVGLIMLPISSFAFFIGILVGLFNVISLLPFYGDGRALRQAWSNRKNFESSRQSKGAL